MLEGASGKRFFLIGNHLCVDFVNTQIVRDGQPVDLLSGIEDLISWLVEAEVLDEAKAQMVRKKWSSRREAEKIFESALELRAILRRMVEQLAKGQPSPQSAIAAINGLLNQQAGYAELRRVKGGYEKRLHLSLNKPVHLLIPVAESACDLLCYGNLSLIKKCENSACILFFYDTTKNHSRRWCSMEACGNRMKVAAHYRRLRERTPPK
jgi:predicted RNA-binding Zn ribbon-like protein